MKALCFATFLLALPAQADETTVERAVLLVELAQDLCANSNMLSIECDNMNSMQATLSQLLLAELEEVVNETDEETTE